jgi:hypothetical protein
MDQSLFGPSPRAREAFKVAHEYSAAFFLFCLLTVNYSQRRLLMPTAKVAQRLRKRGVNWSPMSALGHKRTNQSAPVPADVRYAYDSGQSRAYLECPLSANRVIRTAA